MTRTLSEQLDELIADLESRGPYNAIIPTHKLLDLALGLRVACRERDEVKAQGRREAFMEAVTTCNELASLSDPDTDENAGLKKAARAVKALAQHRGEAGESDGL